MHLASLFIVEKDFQNMKLERSNMNEWGFLRETEDLEKKAGKDRDTGLHRTGLEKYLKVIFPKVNDWIHNKAIGEVDGIKYRADQIIEANS